MSRERGESSSSNFRACAACRHRRRRCLPQCILARYFPARRSAQFDAVHRLFGVSNTLRFYNAAPSHQRNDLMNSLTYEAEVWRYHPALGCIGLIHDLRARIDATTRELDTTFRQLAFYRQQEEQQQQIQMQQVELATRQQQQQMMMMMMMPPPLASVPELHADSFPQQQQMMMMPPPLAPMPELLADSFPQQQQAPLVPPSLPPPIPMNFDDDRRVDIGRMNECSGNSHGWRLSDEEAMRSFNRAAAPLDPAVDLRSHMPGSSSNHAWNLRLEPRRTRD